MEDTSPTSKMVRYSLLRIDKIRKVNQFMLKTELEVTTQHKFGE
jgi:hypothetical protein